MNIHTTDDDDWVLVDAPPPGESKQLPADYWEQEAIAPFHLTLKQLLFLLTRFATMKIFLNLQIPKSRLFPFLVIS